jgi:Na+/H+ antiporter NhaD/arsenite permease-like protein
VAFVVLGGVLASLVGTTGASLLLVRPFLRANEGRENRAHLVPFFILIVANAGGLLTPLGDPPLLVGYTIGVPFLWTLRLFPVWLLYVGTLALALSVVDRRAHAGETPRRRRPGTPLRLRGARNVALLLAVIPASLLPFGAREGVLTAITLVSLAVTPRDVHVANRFAWGPIAEVSILFAGVFLTLAPVEALLSARAHSLPFARAWQLFWASGTLSSILDSAPTYAAFAAIARGLATGSDRIAGMTPVHLAAISVGTVVMGATTYVGNAPNLLVAAIARGERLRVPSFLRYAAFAFVAMLPAHLVTTLALVLLDR